MAVLYGSVCRDPTTQTKQQQTKTVCTVSGKLCRIYSPNMSLPPLASSSASSTMVTDLIPSDFLVKPATERGAARRRMHRTTSAAQSTTRSTGRHGMRQHAASASSGLGSDRLATGASAAVHLRVEQQAKLERQSISKAALVRDISTTQEHLLRMLEDDTLHSILDDEHDIDATAPDELMHVVEAEAQFLDNCLHELGRVVCDSNPQVSFYLQQIQRRLKHMFKRVPYLVYRQAEDIEALQRVNHQLTAQLTAVQLKVREAAQAIQQLQDGIAQAHATAVAENQKPNYLQHFVTSPKDAAHDLEDLYKLQRARLTRKIAGLEKERDMWCGVSFSLGSYMVDVQSLNSLRRLRLHQGTWSTLAARFGLALKELSDLYLTNLKKTIDQWKKDLASLAKELFRDSAEISASLKLLLEEVQGTAVAVGRAIRNKSLSSFPFDKTSMLELLEKWQRTFSEVLDDNIAARFDHVKANYKIVEGGVDQIVATSGHIFKCHRPELAEKNQPKLRGLNEAIQVTIDAVLESISSGSEIVDLLMTVRNALEQCVIDLSDDTALTFSWVESFNLHLASWRNRLENALTSLRETHEIKHLVVKADDYVLSTTMDTRAQCNRIIDQVDDQNRKMVRWFVEVLKLVCGLKEATVTTLSESMGDVVNGLEYSTKEVTATGASVLALSSDMPSTSEDEDGSHALSLDDLDRVTVESQQWRAQAVAILGKVRDAINDDIDIQRVLGRNHDVPELTTAWDTPEGHVMTTISDTGNFVVEEIPDYAAMASTKSF
eukprot:m.12861 g.12861  ORF g.12861 m.12861 type:complete len:775 (-) comp5876_c0_seq2:1038-3362(-)